MKKKTYKLKELSYVGLSLSYLGLIILTFVIFIVLAAMSTTSDNWVMVIIYMLLGTGIIFYIVQVGTKYGEYGLVILFGKLLQPKHIRNDFPLLSKNLITTGTLTTGTLTMDTLSPQDAKTIQRPVPADTSLIAATTSLNGDV